MSEDNVDTDGKRYVPPCHSAADPTIPEMAAWVRFLPDAYAENPNVVVYMVPAESTFRLRGTSDPRFKDMKCFFAECVRVNELTGKEDAVLLPLALQNMDYGNYVQQRKVMDEIGSRFHEVAYSGPLADIPMKCLMSKDFIPVLTQYDKPHESMLDLRKYMTSLTKAANING